MKRTSHVSEKAMTQRNNAKKYAFYVLGFIIGISGLTTALVYFGDFLFRSIGILVILVGAYVVRIAKESNSETITIVPTNSSNPPGVDRPTRQRVWVLFAVSLVASGISFIFMIEDAKAGYEQVWPVYAFALTMTIFALTSGYVASTFAKKIFSHQLKKK